MKPWVPLVQCRLVPGGLVLALVLLGVGLVTRLCVVTADSRIHSYDREVDPTSGSLAPDFSLRTIDGATLSLRQFRGQTVLVNFWATWCGPCQVEMPVIQSKYEQFKEEGLVVLAVNLDESARAVAEFRETFDLTFELLLDPGAEVQKLYRNRSYPTTVFIDSWGVIRAQHIGVMTEGQLDRYLEQLGLGD
jgi:peroxiredoxin